MLNFCTLFDSYYFHKGLALYRSLERTCKAFTLYVMAFDDASYEKLKELNLSHLVVENETGPFLTPALAACKAERRRNEYCWTCESCVTWYFLTQYGLDHIVYLDADMMFFHDPQPLMDSLEGASVGLSPHFFDNGHYGRYCVQFVYFKADANGLAALGWWKDRCIEWCYDRYEEGRFGDQLYLDSMPSLFQGVVEIQHRGCGVAPWNCDQYVFREDGTILYQDASLPVYFFHFHGISVDWQEGSVIVSSRKRVFPEAVLRCMFRPYGELLRTVYEHDLGKTVSRVIIRNPGVFRRLVQSAKNLLRENPFVQWIYFKFVKGHTGYNRKQLS